MNLRFSNGGLRTAVHKGQYHDQVLARCMQLNAAGHVYSLDHDAEFAEITRANLTRCGLDDWATVVDAPLRPHQLGEKTWNWYSEENLPDVSIDLLVVDGPPMPIDPLIRYPAGPVLFPRLANGATVFLDDAARDGEQWIIEEWIKEFPAIQRREFYCEKGCVLLRFDNLDNARHSFNQKEPTQ